MGTKKATKTMIQRFKLHTPSGVFQVDDNISFQPEQKLMETMLSYIARYMLPREGRYVAVGDAGDCVIYQNGKIVQVSDSG